ncbi:MAG: glycosyltransferase [Bacteroidota bacterium]
MEKKYLLCIGTPAWEGDYQKSTLELLKELSHTHEVLYVEYAFTILSVLRSYMNRNSFVPKERILGQEDRLRFIPTGKAKGLHVLTLPPMLPINWLPRGGVYVLLAKLNAWIAKRSIRKALKKLSFGQPTVINALQPMLGRYLVGAFEENGRIYYCYDEISEAVWLQKHGGWIENEFIPLVDEVVTTSEPLKRKKLSLSVPTSVVKNGVNYELFSQAYASRYDRLGAKLGPKTVGYVGSIDFRMDLDLIQFLVQSRPEVHFLLVGPVADPEIKVKLGGYDNVVFVGPQQPHRLPEWLAKMDVGIIPYVNNGFTQNIYPMKVNEYLAAGLAVVSTDFGDLQDFQEVITITDQTNEFLKAIDEGLSHRTIALATERTMIAKGNSWKARARKLGQVIEKVANKKEDDPSALVEPQPVRHTKTAL